MNLKAINALLSKLPDGPKKESFMKRFQSATSPKANGGLNDTFEFETKGHIMIERIDEAGNSLGVLADQPNLVVDGAEEIMLRAFSGDPDRTLYKNRTPKATNGVTQKFHIGLTDNISSAVDGVDQLNFAPNVFWKAVDDSQFNITYSYRPKTVYLKEEVSEQVGKKAFSISTKSSSGAIPITSEIYSAQTNMFIGLGDGKDRAIDFEDARIEITGGFEVAEGKAVATTENASLKLTEKLGRLVVKYEKSNTGGQIGVYVDGTLKETIETYDSSLAEPVSAEKVFADLDRETSHEVELRFTGKDPSITEGANVVITGLRSDGLTEAMNGLAHEFENFTKSFQTITSYSTSTNPPYVAQLEHFPVVPESLEVSYEDETFERVEDRADLADGKYFLDEKKGTLEFNKTLSGLHVTYDITGERYDLKAAAALTNQTVTSNVTGEAVGTGDGTVSVFNLANTNVVSSSLVLKVNGEVVTTGFGHSKGVITFSNAPAVDTVITADYRYTTVGKVYNAPVVLKEATVFDANTGKELALVATDDEFNTGKFKLSEDKKSIVISTLDAEGTAIVNYDIYYTSEEIPGFETGYARAVIEKPKAGTAYPWYQLDKGTVSFIAEFPEQVPAYNVTIREMGLFNGPRKDDAIEGFTGFPVDAYSLVRVGDTVKDVTTGIRVTWTIKLLNKNGDAFKGGF
ncbi:hypothetical protein TCA2_4528 [Paenibacillus sp. TCA20]|uniref:hypothetical protein n=1 Tax=Paenibacillus sp. TCA20 TaxID=1499968 RepID=UPI0004DA1FEE|nr:hypothetical protein [Paenibacillus sp. TCA20]GAK42036.1 hypothetical protein TCA2_4528 [Paenibacillus sp. TCA20]